MTSAWWIHLVGEWGKPGDGAAWGALVLGAILFVVAWTKRTHLIFRGDDPKDEKNFVTYAAAAAAFLSLGYVAFYLRGAPRIIDAGAYFFEARALANGHFTLPALMPSANFRGRFLLYDESAHSLTGILPPEYPFLLSLGMRLGAPMVVGPVLAFALVLATARLAREWLQHTTIPQPKHREIVRVAVLANVLCATLRYHTADTMSHGLAALLVTIALAESLRGKREPSNVAFGIAGLAIGCLAATRLASSLPPIAIALYLATRTPPKTSKPPKPGEPNRDVVFSRALSLPVLLSLFLGLLPGLALLADFNAEATGSAFRSTQRMYYALSDGPPDCFRYGFGKGIGCVYEHGDFVRARIGEWGDSYGVIAACGTTLRRLRAFSIDVANLELLAIVPFFSLRMHAAKFATRVLFALVGLFVLAYAPFYFDGNYPGGGARFFSDVLPVTHVLFAAGAFEIATRVKRVSYTQIATVFFGLSCVGFAVHASFDHRALRDRDGGAPLGGDESLKDARIKNGLVFVDTDLGFLIDHDPSTDAKKGIVIARHRGDAHDRVLFENLGKPASFTIERKTVTHFVPYTPPIGAANSYRFELEAEWPPLAQEDGFAIPAWVSGTCASQAQVLRVTASAGKKAHVRIALPIPLQHLPTMVIAPRVLGTAAHGRAVISIEEVPNVSWTFDDIDHACKELAPTPVLLPTRPNAKSSDPSEIHVRIDAEGAPVDLDAITLRP